MPALIGFLLVVIAAASVIGVLWIVMREKHEHEDHYIPGQTPEMRATNETTKLPDTRS